MTNSTVFVAKSLSTPIKAAWLNDVNQTIFGPTAPAGTLRADLASSTTELVGAAMVAYNSARAYTPGSVGHALNNATTGSTFVSVKQFGAVGDGTTDDTTSIQNAINYCQGAHALFLPAGTYKCTSSLTVLHRLRLFGEGARISIISSTASEALIVAPPLGTGNIQSFFHDFGIQPVTPGTGTSGLVWRLVSDGGSNICYASNFSLDRLYIGDFGGYGLNFDNSVGNANGFFTFTVRRCWITNGVILNKVGDSCNIEQNTITDGATVTAAKTGGRVGVLYTGLSGARQVVIRENNITTSGGAIACISAEQPRLQNNQCEHPFYYGVPYGASGPYNALIYLYNTTYGVVSGNTIQPGGATTISKTGSTHSNTTIDSLSSMTGLLVGMTVSGSGIPAGTRVTVVGGSSVTISPAATTSVAGGTIVFGYSPDYSVLVEGTGSAYNTIESNDFFKGKLYHLGLNSGAGVPNATLGLGNTYEGGTSSTTPNLYNPDGNLYAWGLPQVTTATLPSAATIAGGLVYDTTEQAIKMSNGTSWFPVGGSTQHGTVNIFHNPFFDIYGNVDPAVGPPIAVSGAASAVKETGTVFPGNPTAVSMSCVSSGTTIANGITITPSQQPWLDSVNTSVAIAIPIRSNSLSGRAVVYVYNGSTYTLIGDITVAGTWQVLRGTVNLIAGNNWSIVVAVWNGSTYVSGWQVYVGGLSIVKGKVPPNDIEDSIARRTYVVLSASSDPGYAPAFLGQRFLRQDTTKWWMAIDSSAVGSWIALN
jgi:hypothetical protein